MVQNPCVIHWRSFDMPPVRQYLLDDVLEKKALTKSAPATALRSIEQSSGKDQRFCVLQEVVSKKFPLQPTLQGEHLNPKAFKNPLNSFGISQFLCARRISNEIL